MTNKLDCGWFLSPKGPVAERLKGYEVRPQQMEMARGVAEAFEKSCHLVAEAGTGVGKSFAYLVPILRQVRQKRQKVIVSTYTISLQEQLIRKDIPFIRKAANVKLTAVLAKGRGNYLCYRRLEQAQKRQTSLFEDARDLDALDQLYRWALETRDGSLSDLATHPAASVWEMVCSDPAASAIITTAVFTSRPAGGCIRPILLWSIMPCFFVIWPCVCKIVPCCLLSNWWCWTRPTILRTLPAGISACV